ncbi:MAG TPA: hypothetical protein VLB12_15115 [Gemmatimonadales bacterium]|nr:hypothetical protein [Gemmatimonadales bacterium]
MNIHLRPPTEGAGIPLGSTRSDALRHCLEHGKPSEFRRNGETRASLVLKRASGLSIFVYFDPEDFVEAIEFGRPRSGEDVILYRDVDIFGTEADELIQRLSEYDRIEVSEQGRSVTAPDVLLALWRPVLPEHPEDEDGRYFESVLIARPGYYD